MSDFEDKNKKLFTLISNDGCPISCDSCFVLLLSCRNRWLLLNWFHCGLEAFIMTSMCERGDNLSTMSLLRCLKCSLAPFFNVRYPRTGPHVQCAEVRGTPHNHTECACVSRAMGYAGTASDLFSVTVLLMCMHRSAHHIWSNSGL